MIDGGKEQLRLQIVIASTRPGRVGKPIGEWMAAEARQYEGFEVEVADLAEINLPFFDESNHPRFQKYEHQHTKDWSARVAASDAYVFVQPEYNYGISAPLKNALDYLVMEWNRKPAAFVSYGGVSAGLRAAQHTRQVLAALNMMPIAAAVSIPFVGSMMHDGEFQPSDIVQASVVPMLDELHLWAAALQDMRRKASSVG
ncbi:NADPH-dependent FMN reductase [Deinococcus marmoris]|uniref:Reductase n=1 Tax=Deinococcus marmoris TaxID=249408 RepID=A0A1U7NTI4_9DEIO|nr:NAD(P)H-dependent oxidoreductase [Deinococcus marmoris]OLV16238.1 reductase [Deinococcus marmoris]